MIAKLRLLLRLLLQLLPQQLLLALPPRILHVRLGLYAQRHLPLRLLRPLLLKCERHAVYEAIDHYQKTDNVQNHNNNLVYHNNRRVSDNNSRVSDNNNLVYDNNNLVYDKPSRSTAYILQCGSIKVLPCQPGCWLHMLPRLQGPHYKRMCGYSEVQGL
jgi:hypothetical protein